MSMIYSRAPLRISLGGGGTDLPSYYAEHGGFLIAGAIDKYVYMLAHTVFQRRYRMKYSEIEEVDAIAEIRHPILRETLLRHWRGNPLEIAFVADVPGRHRHGLLRRLHGRLLKGLAHARRTSITPAALAEAACEIEIDVLGEPVGKQDPTSPRTAASAPTPFTPTAPSTSSRSSSRQTTLRLLRERCCSSTPARHAPPRPCSPTRTSAPRPAMSRCSRTCTGPRRSGC